tara:strand:+ start:1217 stop:1504 length:288 start_codon:yes stop_codon:yes gene_type:complete
MKEEEFLAELQGLLLEIDNLVDRYEMRHKIMSVFVAGLLEPVDENTSNMKAMFNYIVDSRDELDTMIDFISTSYDESGQKNDLDDLLDGLGISLN